MPKSKAAKASQKDTNVSKPSPKVPAPVTEKEKAPKVKSKSKSKPEPEPEPVVEEEPSEDEDDWEDEDGDEDEEDSDDEFDGVDEEGMERLLKALGKNGLDEFDEAQLNSLHGDDSDEEDGEGSEEVEGEGDDDDEASASDEDDEEEQEDLPKASSSRSLADSIKALVGDPLDSSDDSGDDEEGAEDEEVVALDEADDSVDEDAIPKRKVEIDNTVALERIRETIALDPSLPWTETLVVDYPEKIEVDVSDDLNRELAFYKQALHGANMARSLAQKHKLAFTRPADYFAEMVKTDAHMERIRQRLLNEKAGIKKSEDKRKEREGKKFGKQVQIEKLKEREKSKKEMEDRIKGLKRKRKDMVDGEGDGDDFDVAVEEAISDKPSAAKRSKLSRDGRNKKFGFGGGAGRHSKSNTRESTDNFQPTRGGGKGGRGGRGGRGGGRGGGGARGGARGGKAPRPGKSKRQNSRR